MLAGEDPQWNTRLRNGAVLSVDKLAYAPIAKVDNEQQLVFGWAYQAITKDGDQVTDHSGDEVTPDLLADFENSVYEYVLESREGGEMHVAKGVSRLVESVLITPEKLEKMGAPTDALPVGWWVGFKVDDAEVWKRVKNGELTMFSIGGAGKREEITE